MRRQTKILILVGVSLIVMAIVITIVITKSINKEIVINGSKGYIF